MAPSTATDQIHVGVPYVTPSSRNGEMCKSSVSAILRSSSLDHAVIARSFSLPPRARLFQDESSSRSSLLFEHDLRANASRLSRGKTGIHFSDHALSEFTCGIGRR